MLATCCQGFEEVAQASVPEGSCCGWPFKEALFILVTTLSVACIGSDVAEAPAPLVLDYCSVAYGLCAALILVCKFTINGLWCFLSCSAHM